MSKQIQCHFVWWLCLYNRSQIGLLQLQLSNTRLLEKKAIFLRQRLESKDILYSFEIVVSASRELRQNLLLYGVLFFRSKALSIKKRSSEVMPSLNLLQKNLMARSKDIGEVCERNIYTIQFLLTIAELKQVRSLTKFFELTFFRSNL